MRKQVKYLMFLIVLIAFTLLQSMMACIDGSHRTVAPLEFELLWAAVMYMASICVDFALWCRHCLNEKPKINIVGESNLVTKIHFLK